MSASRQLGADDALKLAASVDRIVATKGRSVVTFDMKNSPPDRNRLLAAMLGPTGNLRAPTLRVGRTLLVGFSEEAYAQTFGK